MPTIDVYGTIRRLKIVPVIIIDDAAHAVGVADALTAGGLPCAEITFRTPAAAQAIQRIAGERPDVLVGAGTVLDRRQAAEAKAAGAQFMVSPGFHRSVVDYCAEHDIPVFPGICTPTEIGMALDSGLRVLKFFPAEPMGGIAFLRAISAPFPDLEFIPTGGINAGNLQPYLETRGVMAVGGSWMAPREWIDQGEFERIRNTTAVALERMRNPRATVQL